jgi:hypothetical protein
MIFPNFKINRSGEPSGKGANLLGRTTDFHNAT